LLRGEQGPAQALRVPPPDLRVFPPPIPGAGVAKALIVIRIAIAEELATPRWALREALSKIPDFDVVGEAGTVDETLAMLRATRPDLLIVDTLPSERAGSDLLAEIRELEVGPLVLVLASYPEPAYAARVLAAGAHGCVAKSSDPHRLLDAIRAVVRGEQVLPPGAGKLLALGDRPPAGALSARELQVMEMLARGMTNREIADYLVISIKTVDTHRAHVLKKLRLRNNSDLTRFAVKHGYVGV
jgi:DNA-binding NarL/FixJ family response regulator